MARPDREFFRGTEAECKAVLAKLNTFLGLPSGRTLNYGRILKHERLPGTCFLVIKGIHSFASKRIVTDSEISRALSAGEQAKKSRKSEFESEKPFLSVEEENLEKANKIS